MEKHGSRHSIIAVNHANEIIHTQRRVGAAMAESAYSALYMKCYASVRKKTNQLRSFIRKMSQTMPRTTFLTGSIKLLMIESSLKMADSISFSFKILKIEGKT